MVNRRHDPRHPKLAAVVDAVLEHWKAGEKVLVFCFRVNTAERLREIIDDRIRKQLEAGKKKCLGGEDQLKTLRARLTGRDRDLIGLGLDRVLWSFAWAKGAQSALRPEQFFIQDEELPDLVRLSLLFGIDVAGERVDRVFLNRATEHLLAKRFLELNPQDTDFCRLLKRMSNLDWIAAPYALQYSGEEEDPSEDTTSFDERGCHTKYPTNDTESDPAKVAALADALRATRQRARTQKQISFVLAMKRRVFYAADRTPAAKAVEGYRTPSPGGSPGGGGIRGPAGLRAGRTESAFPPDRSEAHAFTYHASSPYGAACKSRIRTLMKG
jgi:hypothetical protein